MLSCQWVRGKHILRGKTKFKYGLTFSNYPPLGYGQNLNSKYL